VQASPLRKSLRVIFHSSPVTANILARIDRFLVHIIAALSTHNRSIVAFYFKQVTFAQQNKHHIVGALPNSTCSLRFFIDASNCP